MSNDGRRTGLGIAAMIAVFVAALVVWIRFHPDPVTMARRAYEGQEWEKAAEALRGEVRTERGTVTNPEILRLYARTLVRLERDDAASAIYNKRLDDTDLEPEDRFLLGAMSARSGKPEKAFEHWEQARKEGFEPPELLDHVARLSLSVNIPRVDLAAEASRMLTRQPGWEARGYFLLASIQEIVGDPSGVVDACRSALDRDPSAHNAPSPQLTASYYRKLLARNLLRLGRSAEAQQQLESVLTNRKGEAFSETQVSAGSLGASPSLVRTEDREAYWLLSRAHLQQGHVKDAADALARTGSYAAENRLKPEPSPYVGSAACASCHAAEDRTYQGTRHTRSFHHGPGLLALPLPDRPLTDPDDPKVTHTIEKKDQQLEVHTRAGDRAFQMVVDYAFGTRERYVTMVGRDDEKNYRALRLSHFQTSGGSGWDRTSGDVGHSDEFDNLRGQKIDVLDGMVRCLYCHTTRSRDFRHPPPDGKPGPEASDAGIGCERCHGPGGNHIKAMERDFSDRAIVNVAGAPAATINTQCADCHIVGLRSQIEMAPEDPNFVRSTGVTLTLSRCYTDSDGGMSCLTCHDPHREAVHSAEYYESKCLACHSRQAVSPPLQPPSRRAVCPVNPAKDCLGCHMPKIPVPALHTTLTDHYIRVHREDRSQKTGKSQ